VGSTPRAHGGLFCRYWDSRDTVYTIMKTQTLFLKMGTFYCKLYLRLNLKEKWYVSRKVLFPRAISTNIG
jgi:hypothetical protein